VMFIRSSSECTKFLILFETKTGIVTPSAFD
jgi:hypothetical protein